MGVTLTGKTIASTYTYLLKVSGNSNIGSSIKKISDGDGNEANLYLSTTQTLVGAGSVSVPSLAIFGSTTTGLYSPNSAQLGISIAGSQKALFYSGGLTLTGDISVSGGFKDSNNTFGTSGQVLASTGSGTDWVNLSEISGIDGSGTLNTIPKFTPDGNTIGDSNITDSGSTVNISGGSNTNGITVASNVVIRHKGSEYITTQDDLIQYLQSIKITDNKKLLLGSGSDLEIYHDGSNSYIKDTGTGFLNIQTSDALVLSSATGEPYFIGTANGSVKLYYDNSNKFETTSTGIKLPTYTAGFLKTDADGDVILDTNTYLTTADASSLYLPLAGGTLTGTLKLNDNVRLDLGSDSDLRIHHSGSAGTISNLTGNLTIQNSANDADIIFKSDDGSGGTIEYFKLDGSHVRTTFAKDIKLEDNVKILAGTGEDLEIYHDATNSIIRNDTGDLRFIQYVDDGKIRFYNDNGSGGTTEYFRVDGSAEETLFSKQIRVPDNVKIAAGGSQDLQIYHDGSHSYLDEAGTGDFRIRSNSAIALLSDSNEDMVLAVANSYVKLFFNNSEKLATTNTGISVTGDVIASGDVRVPDGEFLSAGNSNDLTITNTGVHALITNYTGNLTLQNLADDSDIIFKSDDGSGAMTTYFYLDGSLADGTYNYTRWNDGGVITIGTDLDLRIWHDPSNSNSYVRNYGGHLYIENTANDKDIVFQSDNGSGGTATYFALDGSDVMMKAHKKLRFLDSVHLTLGNSDDLKIYHDGTDSVIQNETGDLEFQNRQDDGDIKFKSDDGSGGVAEYFRLDGGGVLTFFSKPIQIADNQKIFAGDAGDLQIYHNGTHSYIDDAGTGKLILRGNTDVEIHKYTGEYMITATADGAVKLYYDDSLRLETTSAGIKLPSYGAGYLKTDANGNVSVDSSTIEDTLQTVTDRGASSTNTITLANSSAASNPLILGSSNQTSYTLQQWKTSAHGTNEAYIIAYGAGHGSQAGNFAMKNVESGGEIFFELAGAVEPLRMTSTSSTFAGNITATGSRTISAQYDSNHFIRLESNSSGGVLKGLDGGVTKILARSYGNTFFDGGNFGIGTGDSPTAKLHVQNNVVSEPLALFQTITAGDASVRIEGIGGESYLEIASTHPTTGDTSNSWGIGMDDNTSLSFGWGTNNTLNKSHYLTITNTGNATFAGVINANGGINVTGNIDTPEISINDYVKHNGDTNTYFGFSGADTYKVVTGGTDALTIDSNQNATFANNIYLTSSSKVIKADLSSGGTTRTAEIEFYNSSNGAIKYMTQNSSTGGHEFYTQGAKRFEIEKGGTATFAGNITANGDITIDNSSGDPFLKLKTTAQEWVVRIDQSDSEKFQIRNVTGTETALSIDTSSNVTIAGNTIVGGYLGVDNIKSDTTNGVQFLTTGNSAQFIRTKAIQVSSSYGGTPPTQGILFGTDTNLYRDSSNVLKTDDSLIVAGDLTVQGTTTTIDTTNLDVKDKNITLNYGSGDTSANADGAGITIQDAVNASTDATMTWNTTSDSFNFSNSVNVTGGITSTSNNSYTGGMSSFETTLTNNDDWQNSPISILERANIGTGSADDKYSPNLNFHWSGRVSRSLWMDATGNLNYGEYDGNGSPGYSNGIFRVQEVHSSVFKDKDSTGYYLDPANTGTSLNVAGAVSTGGYLTLNSSDNIPRLIFNGSGDDFFLSNTATYFGLYNDTDGRWDIKVFGDGSTTFAGSVHLDSDSAQLQFGDDNDMQIYHNGANGVIDNNTGDLILRSDSDDIKILAEDDVVIRDNDDSTEMAKFINGGAVELYHNGSKKFETTSTGVKITAANTSDLALNINDRIKALGNGTLSWGSSANFGNLTWDTGYALVGGLSGKGLKLFTNGGSGIALTIDTSQNATFAGSVTATSFSGDGSNLTGVTGEWDGSLTGNASITGNLTVTGDIINTSSTSIFSNGAYLEIGTGASNTAQLTFNADYDGGQTATYTPHYAGASSAGMSIIKMPSGGVGGLEFFVRNHGTTGGSHALSTFTKILNLHQDGYASFGGNAIPAADGVQTLGNSSNRWGALEIKSGGQIQWQNGDARIIEGLVNNYSLSFQTYDSSTTTLSTALRLDGDNTATFAGDVDFDGNITLTGSTKNIVLNNSNELRAKDTGGTERTIARVQSGNTLQYGWSGAGDVEFKGGGTYTTRMVIDSATGRIGIGEAVNSPSSVLHVMQNQGANNDAVLRLRGKNTTNRITRLQFEDYSGALADGLIQFRIPTADTASSAVFEIGVNSAGLTLDHSNNATFAGNVTIEKSTPTLTFNNLAGGGLDPILEASGSNFNIKTTSVTPLSINLSTQAATFGGNIQVDGKNVGIGGTPADPTHGTIATKLDLKGSDDSIIIMRGNTASTEYGLYAYNGDFMITRTNQSTWWNNPDFKLNSGNATFAGTVSSQALTITPSGEMSQRWNYYTSGGNDYSLEHHSGGIYIYNRTTSTSVWSWSNAGYFGIGTDVTPSLALDVKGTTNLASRFMFTKDLSTDKVLFGGADHDTFGAPFIGSSSNHSFTITQNGAAAITIDTSKNATFTGEIISGSQVTVDSNWVSDEGSLSIVHDQNTLGGIGIVANSVYKGGLIQRDGTSGDYMELTTYTSQPLKLRTSNTDTVTIATNGETTIKRAVDGDFTGLRIMNQKHTVVVQVIMKDQDWF